MMTLMLMIAMSGAPTIPESPGATVPPSDVDIHNERMLEETSAIARQNRLVMRLVMGFDLCGFVVFYTAVRKAARDARTNEARVIAIGLNIDQMLMILRAESTIQGHVIEQAKNIAQANSAKLDAVKSQIDANTASIISEAKVLGESGFDLPRPAMPEIV